MERIPVQICSTDYVILSDEPESYVRRLAEKLDAQIAAMLTEDPRMSVTMASILCALDYADQAEKSGQSDDNLRLQLKEYLDDNARLRQECETLRRELGRVRSDGQYL